MIDTIGLLITLFGFNLYLIRIILYDPETPLLEWWIMFIGSIILTVIKINILNIIFVMFFGIFIVNLTINKYIKNKFLINKY